MGARKPIRSASAASSAPATTSATVKGILNRFASALNAAEMTIRPTSAPTMEMTALSALATARMKQGEAGIIVAGAALGLPVILVDEAALKEMEARTLSQSAQSLAAAGTPSVSEAAALAAAGEGSRLLGPRIVVGNVTCALAIGGDGA